MVEKKTEKKFISGLQSTNADEVCKTINDLRETGSSIYIPLLIELMHTSDNPEIKERIFKLLCDLKQTDAIPLIIDAIDDPKYSSELRVLVASCWENGLDFTPYLPVFVDMVINKEFMTSFEAFTVIENMEGKITSQMKSEQIMKVKDSLGDAPAEKQQLLEDLIEIIDRFQILEV